MIRASRLTFSAAALVKYCDYSLVEGVQVVDEPNEYSTGGTEGHHALACVTKGQPVPPIEDHALAYMVATGRRWLEGRGLSCAITELRAEVAFAYDLGTGEGRELIDPEGAPIRWYAEPVWRAKYNGPGGPIRETEVCGRLDLVGRGLDGHGEYGFVGDFKFHFGMSFVDALDQLTTGAVAVAAAWGCERIKGVGVHLFSDEARSDFEEEWIGTVREDDENDRDVKNPLPEMSAFALADYADALARKIAGDNDPQPKKGPHCSARYCRAQAACPETHRQLAKVIELFPASKLVRRPEYSIAHPATTNEEGAERHVALDLVEAWLTQARAEQKALADQLERITLSDGSTFSGRPRHTETPNLAAPGAVEVLERHELDFAIETKVTTTWEAIKAVKGKAVADAVREELRAIDALHMSDYRVYTVQAPPKPKGAKKSGRKAS